MFYGKSTELKQSIKEMLHDDYHLEHIILELEHIDEDCTYKGCN